MLRVGFALSIVGVAIGMTAAASDTVARCDASAVSVLQDGATACAPPAAGGTGEIAAAPLPAERSTAKAAVGDAHDATVLVALATGLVLFSIFAILLSYRPRPGGVRTSHR